MKFLAIASVALLLTQSVAFAKDGHSHGKGKGGMQAMDADKDGKLSKDEVKADSHLTQSFDTVDGNKDGFLDKDELKAAHGGKKGAQAPSTAPAAAPSTGTTTPATTAPAQ